MLLTNHLIGSQDWRFCCARPISQLSFTASRSLGMDATFSDSLVTAPVDSREFKSRAGALAWSFRKSRDRWKAKYKKLKTELKRYTNRVADVTKSREHWKAQAEGVRKELGAREAEIVTLRQQIASMEVKKKSTPAASH